MAYRAASPLLAHFLYYSTFPISPPEGIPIFLRDFLTFHDNFPDLSNKKVRFSAHEEWDEVKVKIPCGSCADRGWFLKGLTVFNFIFYKVICYFKSSYPSFRQSNL